jgi:hypothetical protein
MIFHPTFRAFTPFLLPSNTEFSNFQTTNYFQAEELDIPLG